MPVAGAASQTVEELQSKSATSLCEDLEDRLRKAPVYFDLVLQLATDGDPTDDPSAPWPEDRIRIKLRSIEIHRPTSGEEIGDAVMLHDLTRVTDHTDRRSYSCSLARHLRRLRRAPNRRLEESPSGHRAVRMPFYGGHPTCAWALSSARRSPWKTRFRQKRHSSRSLIGRPAALSTYPDRDGHALCGPASA